MTIVSNKNTPRNTYTASANQTSFAISFEFYQIADVKVYKNGTLLTYNATPSGSSQYSITGTASASDNAYEFGSGGSITLGAGASANDIIVIIRDISVERTTDFPNSGAFDITSLNTQLDTLTSIVADVKTQTDRSVKLLDTDTVSATVTLPAKATRQSKIMGFDANGNIETTVSSDGLSTLSGIATDISTVAGISSNVTSVAGNSSNINTLAGLNSQITSLGAISSDISTLAGFNSSDISTVAGDIAKVVTAANDLNESTSEIEVVANAITNIDAVGNAITNVNTVAGIDTEITNVSGISAAISAVNSNSTNINAVNSNKTNIDSVAGAVPNINSVATNLSAVQNFADVYRIASSAPTSSLNQGDLYFDTTANELKVYKSSGWAAAGSTVNGTANRFEYTATAGQTTFTGADSNGAVMAYDSGFADIYLNGVKLANADFTATSGTSVVLAFGAALNDVLMVVAYGTFQLANISINNLTDTPASIGTAGQALVVNSGGTALEYSNASSAEVYGFEKYFAPSTINITVTDSGGIFYISGVAQDTLNLLEGNTYIFTYPSSHPFALSTTSNGTHGGGSEYTTGVTRNSGSNTLTYIVPTDAPQLYYYCTSHSNMGGTANTPVPSNNALRVRTTNQGADDITQAQYNAFSDTLFSASGFTFSLNNNGNLIATI
ncbi:MAG: putative tail fiber protein [Prokaryotic dsDNA virus sp.]|nr:MAG: putative tail fiber protein [Prokaryotic dsDNA virus sp.]|tara:strand:- start:1002 stop:3011 length:2010 start_codon:yes stop_codon:yes gene_type:complete